MDIHFAYCFLSSFAYELLGLYHVQVAKMTLHFLLLSSKPGTDNALIREKSHDHEIRNVKNQETVLFRYVDWECLLGHKLL